MAISPHERQSIRAQTNDEPADRADDASTLELGESRSGGGGAKTVLLRAREVHLTEAKRRRDGQGPPGAQARELVKRKERVFGAAIGGALARPYVVGYPEHRSSLAPPAGHGGRSPFCELHPRRDELQPRARYAMSSDRGYNKRRDTFIALGGNRR